MIRTKVISILLSIGLVGSLGACTQGAVTQQLVDALKAYAEAAASDAPTLARREFSIAQRSLNDAELARRENAANAEELAFVAKRRAQIATAKAGAAAAANLAQVRAQRVKVLAPPPAQVTVITQDNGNAEELEKRNAELAAKGQQLDDANKALSAKDAELATQTAALEAEKAARAKLEAERDSALNNLKAFAMVVENERGTVITLGGALLFRSNENTLMPTAKAKLDQVAIALKSISTEQTLVIEGHADARGSADLNRRLSAARAEAVRAYLVTQGVAPAKLTSFGKGEDQPVASNDTAEGRANNRRVEIVISRAKSAAITK